ncbi:hypothetical protein D9M71_647710 [compost metagenome]
MPAVGRYQCQRLDDGEGRIVAFVGTADPALHDRVEVAAIDHADACFLVRAWVNEACALDFELAPGTGRQAHQDQRRHGWAREGMKQARHGQGRAPVRLTGKGLGILDSWAAPGFETFLKLPRGLNACFVNCLTRADGPVTAHPIGSNVGIGEWKP